MDHRITTGGRGTIDLVLGERWSDACVLEAGEEVVETFRVRTAEPALAQRLGEGAAARIVLEVGTQSPWMGRLLSDPGS